MFYSWRVFFNNEVVLIALSGSARPKPNFKDQAESSSVPTFKNKLLQASTVQIIATGTRPFFGKVS